MESFVYFGSSLLVISYEEKDKFTAQGLNDFIVFSTQGIELYLQVFYYIIQIDYSQSYLYTFLLMVFFVSFLSSKNKSI